MVGKLLDKQLKTPLFFLKKLKKSNVPLSWRKNVVRSSSKKEQIKK
jgi:hypothetical protein